MRVPLPLDTPDAEQPELREAGSTVGESNMSGMDACIRQREMGAEMRQVVDKADAGLGGLLRPLRCDEFKGSREASGASGLGLPGPCGPLVEIPDADVDRDPHQVSFLSEQPVSLSEQPVSEPHASHEPTGAELGVPRPDPNGPVAARGVLPAHATRDGLEQCGGAADSRGAREGTSGGLAGHTRGADGARKRPESKNPRGKTPIPGSSSGRTADFESVNGGSIPPPGAWRQEFMCWCRGGPLIVVG